MKILIISPYPLPNNPIKGGVEAVTHNLIEGFRKLPKIEVRVLSFMHSLNYELKITDNINIYFIKKRYRRNKIEMKWHARSVLLEINNNWKPDIIQVEGNGSNFLLYHSSISNKLIFTQHGVLSEERRVAKDLRSIINLCMSEYIEQKRRFSVRNWIFISKYNQSLNEDIIKSGINFKQIFNPVNPEYFSTETTLNGHRCYFVGRLIPRKGIHTLVEALGKLTNENINIDLIGDFDSNIYRNKILKHLNKTKKKNNVAFHGWRSGSEIREIIKDNIFLILPSFQETLPVVIAEAMAMGKIVIATKICGIPEMVIDGETGFLFDPGDSDTLSKILENTLLMSEDQLMKMSKNAKERAHKLFDPITIANEHLKFYKAVLHHNRNNERTKQFQ